MINKPYLHICRMTVKLESLKATYLSTTEQLKKEKVCTCVYTKYCRLNTQYYILYVLYVIHIRTYTEIHSYVSMYVCSYTL